MAILFYLSSCSSAAPKPDIANWKSSSIPGPALFLGTLIRSEKFNDPRDASYSCREIYGQQNPSSPTCITNACGLERLTFSVNMGLSGQMPKKITLNRVTGEWCDGVSARGVEFLVTIQRNGHWYGTKVIELKKAYVALTPLHGCLGDINLKKALKTQGITLTPRSYQDRNYSAKNSWYVLWVASGDKPDCWKRLPSNLANKGLSVKVITDLWKNVYQKKH